MSRVAVAGASGMLGAYGESFLRLDEFDIISSTCSDLLSEPTTLCVRFGAVAPQPRTLSNCVEVIHPQVVLQGSAETIRVNSLVPMCQQSSQTSLATI